MPPQDFKKLTDYWHDLSIKHKVTSQKLFKLGDYPAALFYAHLSMETFLKELIVLTSRDHAPYVHGLAYLAGKIPVEADKQDVELLERLNKFNVQSRYPHEVMVLYEITSEECKILLQAAERLKQWFRRALKIK